MKNTVVILSLVLACGACVLAYQHHRYSAQLERQDRAIALVQSHYEESLRENRALKTELQKKSNVSVARTSALGIAARYQNMPAAPKRTAAR
jgi:hypothetical protein